MTLDSISAPSASEVLSPAPSSPRPELSCPYVGVRNHQAQAPQQVTHWGWPAAHFCFQSFQLSECLERGPNTSACAVRARRALCSDRSSSVGTQRLSRWTVELRVSGGTCVQRGATLGGGRKGCSLQSENLIVSLSFTWNASAHSFIHSSIHLATQTEHLLCTTPPSQGLGMWLQTRETEAPPRWSFRPGQERQRRHTWGLGDLVPLQPGWAPPPSCPCTCHCSGGAIAPSGCLASPHFSSVSLCGSQHAFLSTLFYLGDCHPTPLGALKGRGPGLWSLPQSSQCLVTLALRKCLVEDKQADGQKAKTGPHRSRSDLIRGSVCLESNNAIAMAE